ncbi:MAG TPA: pyrroline-5-carboxylate reductase [Stenotrophomonas sp.]|nr:pyrroline-5-carboxylate reductase [Stenotrophomonas sp.]
MTDTPATVSDKIAFIGGGNMARSLIAGLVRQGVAANTIHVAEPVDALREQLSIDFGVHAHVTAAEAAEGCATWVLAVKPQVMANVCETLAPLVAITRPLVVSIAAGIGSGRLRQWLGSEAAIVRAMPNTPALLGAGVTGLHAGADVDAAGRNRAQALLASAGETVWIEDEALMDAVTAVSGSGPAYVFLLAEAMQAAARTQGLSESAAATLVTQTLLGASRMLAESGEAPAELRRRVTSPKGTTQAAIETLQSGGFEELVGSAIDAATRRGRELSG